MRIIYNLFSVYNNNKTNKYEILISNNDMLHLAENEIYDCWNKTKIISCNIIRISIYFMVLNRLIKL